MISQRLPRWFRFEQSACNVGDLGSKDPLDKGMATHSSILAWRIPMDRGAWQATVHGLQSVVAKSQTWLQLSRGHSTLESTVIHSMLNSQWSAEWMEHGESGLCSTKIEVNCIVPMFLELRIWYVDRNIITPHVGIKIIKLQNRHDSAIILRTVHWLHAPQAFAISGKK